MNLLAQALLLQSAAENISDQQERRRIAQWVRHNATVNRNLPPMAQESNPINLAIGLVDAITHGASISGDSSGKDGGSANTGASPSGASDTQAQPVAAPAASPGNETTGGGDNRQGATVSIINPAQQGPSGSPPAAACPSNPQRPWRKTLPWIIAGVSSLGAAGGIGSAITSYFNKPPDSSLTVIEGDTNLDSEYPVRDYIEDNNWHRK